MGCTLEYMRPMKQLLSTFAPDVPIQVTLLAVVTLPPAFWPKAICRYQCC